MTVETNEHGLSPTCPAPPAAVPPPRTWTHAIARLLIRPLVRTRVTPNHVTTLRLATGLLAAGGFALGTYEGNVWGGLLFLLSTLLDRADGELARLSGRTSRAGHRYDLTCDLLSNAAAFVGMGVGLAQGPLGWIALVMGLVAGASIAAIFFIVFGLHDHGTNPQEAFGSAPGFDLDDGLFLIVPVALLGWLQPLLTAAAVGAPCFLVFALLRYRAVKAR